LYWIARVKAFVLGPLRFLRERPANPVPSFQQGMRRVPDEPLEAVDGTDDNGGTSRMVPTPAYSSTAATVVFRAGRAPENFI
jgi:hypothetical protein